jgi:hypothetical protein
MKKRTTAVFVIVSVILTTLLFSAFANPTGNAQSNSQSRLQKQPLQSRLQILRERQKLSIAITPPTTTTLPTATTPPTTTTLPTVTETTAPPSTTDPHRWHAFYYQNIDSRTSLDNGDGVSRFYLPIRSVSELQELYSRQPKLSFCSDPFYNDDFFAENYLLLVHFTFWTYSWHNKVTSLVECKERGELLINIDSFDARGRDAQSDNLVVIEICRSLADLPIKISGRNHRLDITELSPPAEDLLSVSLSKNENGDLAVTFRFNGIHERLIWGAFLPSLFSLTHDGGSNLFRGAAEGFWLDPFTYYKLRGGAGITEFSTPIPLIDAGNFNHIPPPHGTYVLSGEFHGIPFATEPFVIN